MDQRFEHLALEVLPIGSNPGVVVTRQRIATVLEREIEQALSRQIRNGLKDDIRQLEQQIQSRASALAANERQFQESCHRKLADLTAERDAFRRIVAGHCDLLKAVESWFEWCEGKGGVDERADRWQAVKLAMLNYRSLTKGT